jgi:surfeit locus 1 family protein
LPEGEVAVAGRIDHPPSRLFDFGGSDAGTIRQNLDLDAYSREMKRPLRPLAIVQEDGSSTPPDGLRRDWPAPAVDVQRHYGYAVQWFAMAVLILGLYVRFQLFGRRRHAS